MGATSFSTTSRGDTAEDAYRKAVDDARYWNGHGGYTGTIAEKDGYVLFDIPLYALPERDASVYRFPHDAEPTARLEAAVWWYLNNRTSWDGNTPVTVDPIDATPKDWDVPEVFERLKEDAIALREAMSLAKWEQLCAVATDKWGPAVAHKVGDDEYLFFGLASC